MEEKTKLNPYLVGGVSLAALVVSLLVARGMKEKESAETAAGTQTTEAASPRKLVRYKIPVTNLEPIQGPMDAPVTMVVWCDVRGAVCREADLTFKALMKRYEGKLRWVHRAVADSSRPEEAKLIHRFTRAIYEPSKDNETFWKARELLLALPDGITIGGAELRKISSELGIDYDKLAPELRTDKYAPVISLDMGFGARFGVSQLPGVFINGRPVPRTNTRQDLEGETTNLIDEELEHAQQVLASGVDAKVLYDKIVEDGLWSLDDDPTKRQATAGKPRLPSFKFDEPARKP